MFGHVRHQIDVSVQPSGRLQRRDFLRTITAASIAAGTLSWRDLVAVEAGALKKRGKSMGSTLSAMGGFLVANTMVMTLTERTREVGLLRAAGTTARQVLGIFGRQALALGLAGSVLGVLLGIAFTGKEPQAPPVDVQGMPEQTEAAALASLLRSNNLPAEVHPRAECQQRQRPADASHAPLPFGTSGPGQCPGQGWPLAAAGLPYSGSAPG